MPKIEKAKLKKVILLLTSVISTLIFSEAYFRYYFHRWNSNQTVPFSVFSKPFPNADDINKIIKESNNPKILFELIPNNDISFKGQPFLTNSRGALGNKEYSIEKPDNTLRIVGVGDSVMSSWGVNSSKTFLNNLEKSLDGYLVDKNVEVINLSVPGYNTAIELEVIKEKALAYKPDIIVLGFCDNDLDLPNYIRKKVYTKYYSYFVVNTTVNMITKSLKKQDVDDAINPGLAQADYIESENRFAHEIGEVPPEYEYMVGPDNYLENMNKIAKITQENNTPVVLIYYSDQPKIEEIKAMGFNILLIDLEIQNMIKERGLTEEDLVLGNGDYHLNELGHELYGDALLNYIVNNSDKLIPATDK